MSDLIERKDAIKALRLEYPMMPLFKELREEWAIKTEGYRKAEEVIMKLPSVDTPTTMTGVIDAIRDAEYRWCMKAVEERPQGEWASVLAELHERFDALEKEIRKASAEMSAIIREYVDRPQGEWIYCEDYVGHDGYECSNCGFFIPWVYDYYADSNFILNYHTCPHCDARMKEQKITE